MEWNYIGMEYMEVMDAGILCKDMIQNGDMIYDI